MEELLRISPSAPYDPRIPDSRAEIMMLSQINAIKESNAKRRVEVDEIKVGVKFHLPVILPRGPNVCPEKCRFLLFPKRSRVLMPF